MKTKAIILISSLSLAVSSLQLPMISAQSTSSSSDSSSIDSSSKQSFNYIIAGVNINSDTQLSRSEQIEIYETATQSQLIKPNYIENGSSGEIIDGPVYKTYSNTDAKFVAEFLAGWLTSKIPVAKLAGDKKFFAGFIVGKISNWFTNLFKPTYVGYWTTRSYLGGYYRTHMSIVHYSDSTFSQPISVEYFEVGIPSETP